MKASFTYIAGLALAFLLGLQMDNRFEPDPAAERPAPTLTDSLVADFHVAWNAEDLDEMKARLQPSAFFWSPHQLRYGRSEMLNTVLLVNPPRFKVFESTEWHSHVSEHVAWSIGKLRTRKDRDAGAEYLYLFTPDRERTWKLQILLYQERCN